MMVEQYRQRMNLLILSAGIREESRLTIARFQNGFNYEIRDKLKLFPYNDRNDLVKLFVSVDEQLKRKFAFRKSSSSYYPENFKRENHFSEKSKPFEKEREKASLKEKDKNNFASSSKEIKTKKIQCFKCLEKGHYSSECPQKINLVLKEQDIENIKTSSSSENEEVLNCEEEIEVASGDLFVVQ